MSGSISTLVPAGAPSAWRQFTFFDTTHVRDVHDLASAPEIFHKTPEISCIISTSIGTLMADIHGSMFLLNDNFETAKSWVAHAGGRVTHMVERNGILVTLAEEDAVRHPLLKIWDIQTTEKKTGAPILLRSSKIQSGTRPHPVTTLALTPTLSHLAIGLADGTVLLYRHLDQSIFSGSTSLTAIPKPRTVPLPPPLSPPLVSHLNTQPSSTSSTAAQVEPITGLAFRDVTAESPNVSLFIVTLSRVLYYRASGKGSGGTPVVVDEVGAALGCACLYAGLHSRDSGRLEEDSGKQEGDEEIVIARDEAIYLVGAEGRGACYAYEGHKSFIHTHENHLVIVSPPFAPSAGSASATVRNFVKATSTDVEGSGFGGLPDITKVTVFDLENKLIAYSGTFTEGIREVFSKSGSIYLLSNDGKLSYLQEHPTSQKLALLYRKSLYLLALNLAHTSNLPKEAIADIHKAYGDHLYSKGEYDAAMNQFVKTIGEIPASYVIRKFLDAQRVHNLVTYLQELHNAGLANADHTTLLLNTYTKLKDVSRLESFIRATSSHTSPHGQDELPFDLDTAIRVCRQAGYYDHAGYLAKKYERHEEYLQIQIEDASNYRDALSYLKKLGGDAAESNLARYGRAMVENLPQETTNLLIDICTSSVTSPNENDTDNQTQSVSSRQPSSTGPGSSYLSYLALNRGVVSTQASETATIQPSSASTTTAATTRPVPQGAGERRPSVQAEDFAETLPLQSARTETATTTAGRSVKVLQAKRPSPRVYFAHFVDHRQEFVRFLESVALKRWGQGVSDTGSISKSALTEPDITSDLEAEKDDQIAVWNTLLELYLSPLLASHDDETQQSKEKALRLLRNKDIPYDPTHALILCSTQSFTPGLVLLWEKMSMYEDVLRFWMDRANSSPTDPKASSEVVKCLEQYGNASTTKHLYPLVLRFLTSTPELLSKHTEDLGRILETVEREKIMPPLGVVQVLSRNGVASVGLVKGWLMTRIKEARAGIEMDQKLVDSYRTETASKLRQIEELSDPNRPRVFHVTQCSACGGQLDLPSIHFMCNHSYHQRCLGDHDTECPNCARSHGIIREIRRNNERLADQHDLFLSEVKEGGFAAVAAGFGRGIMNVSSLEDVAT